MLIRVHPCSLVVIGVHSCSNRTRVVLLIWIFWTAAIIEISQLFGGSSGHESALVMSRFCLCLVSIVKDSVINTAILHRFVWDHPTKTIFVYKDCC